MSRGKIKPYSRRDGVTWYDRKGRARCSFSWRYQYEYDQEHIGLDAFERAWYFGAYPEKTREDALRHARERLALRGFDPALADSLVTEK